MPNMPSILELWDFSNVAESEQRFREWLGKTADDNPYHFELKTQLARTYSLRRRFEEAHAVLDEIEPQIHITPIVEVRYLLERGRTFNSSNQQDKAIPLFERAWHIGREHQLDYLAIDAAHMLAIVIPDVEQQITWHRNCLELAEQSEQADAKKWFGSIYNNLGWTYHDEGKYEKALEIFQKALAWQEQRGQVGNIRIAKYTVGRTLRSLKRYNEALEIQQVLLAEHEATGDEDGFVFEEMGECLLALNRADEAKRHFKKAHQLLKDFSWVEQDRLEHIKRLAE